MNTPVPRTQARSHLLPVHKEIRELLEDLLGRSVTVTAAEPVRAEDLSRSLVGVYVDDALRLAAVVAMDVPLAVYSGAAIGLVPPSGAQHSAERRQLPAMLAEHVGGVCGVLGSLLNRDGFTHLRLYQTFLPGQPLPVDAGGYLLGIGDRLDLNVDIGGYGAGRLSLSLAA